MTKLMEMVLNRKPADFERSIKSILDEKATFVIESLISEKDIEDLDDLDDLDQLDLDIDEDDVIADEDLDEGQIDELSNKTLSSYVRKASDDATDTGYRLGGRRQKRDETDRFLNRHMSFKDKDAIHKSVGTDIDADTPDLKNLYKRRFGIKTALNKLSKSN